MGVALMRQVAHNANQFCGDGTTTATILTHSIYKNGLKLIEAGYNPISVKRGIDKAKQEILEFLDLVSEPLEEQEMIFKAAMVATNYDRHLSTVIAEAVEMKGKEGIIHIEPGLEELTSTVVR